MLARQMYDWLDLRYVSFDFKIRSGQRRSRKTQTVVLISAERRRKCCKERNAILGVWIGEKLLKALNPGRFLRKHETVSTNQLIFRFLDFFLMDLDFYVKT